MYGVAVLSLPSPLSLSLSLSLPLHSILVHYPPYRYNCTVCSKSFDRPYRLQRHIQIHNPNRPRVQCQFCDRSFTRIDTLENHVKSLHSSERPFKCTFEGCDKSFPLNSALVHHLKVRILCMCTSAQEGSLRVYSTERIMPLFSQFLYH